MAYYAYDSAREAVQKITAAGGASGLGAYYPWDSAHESLLPINGLGTSDQTLADEELRRMLGRRPPVAVVGEWAEQRTNLVWRPIQSNSELTLIGITDGDLAAAKKGAGGHEVATVGVLGHEPITLERAKVAFEGTPYRMTLPLAVYSISDKRAVPTPLFLWLATYRDPMDRDGGGAPASRAARDLGGALVYVISLPRRAGARHPTVPVTQALRARSRGSLKQDPAAEEQAAAQPSALSLLPWFAAGALAIGAGWWFVKEIGER